MDRLVPEATLARLWRIDPLRPSHWRHNGVLTSDVQERMRGGHASHFYLLDAIDRMHKEGALNFNGSITLPSAAELLAAPEGTPSLLTTEEVADLFGVGKTGVQNQVERGALPVIVLPGGRVFRYPASVVRTLLLAENGTAVNLDVASKMLCMSQNRTLELARTGRLETVRVLGQGLRFYATRASLMAVLDGLLRNVSAEEWWQRRMDTEVFTPSALRDTYHISQPKWMELTAKYALPHITTPTGRYVHVPAWAMDELLAERMPLPLDTLNRLFPVGAELLSKWVVRYRLCTSGHKHLLRTCPSKRCVRLYIEANRTTPALVADDLFVHCLQDGATPATVDEIVESTVGTDIESVHAALHAGEMRGVWLPRGGPTALILRSDAIAWRRATERRLRREYE